MKRMIIGALIGFMLSLGVGAHAEVISMLGKVIDGSFPISIKGVTLQNPAITIAGVSYVPTREFAESLGATVKFDANLGIEVVPSTTPSPTPTTTPSTTPAPAPTPPAMTNAQKIDRLKNMIPDLEVSIQALKIGIISEERDGSKDNNIAMYKQRLADKEKELADLQTQLTALQAQP